MEDGPEDAEGSFAYAGKTYRLEERDSEVWRVYDGDQYLGDVIAVTGISDRGGPTYLARCDGDDAVEGAPTTDDWRSALEYLIDQSKTPSD
jgi:hypothetical protein